MGQNRAGLAFQETPSCLIKAAHPKGQDAQLRGPSGQGWSIWLPSFFSIFLGVMKGIVSHPLVSAALPRDVQHCAGRVEAGG